MRAYMRFRALTRSVVRVSGQQFRYIAIVKKKEKKKGIIYTPSRPAPDSSNECCLKSAAIFGWNNEIRQAIQAST